MTRALQKLVHVGCRELGLDTDARHDLQLVATGKESLADMTEAELEAVVTLLEAKGFRRHKGKRSRPLAPRADLRLIHVLWKKLGAAGALRDPTRAGLNAFVRKRFGTSWSYVPADIDMLREARQIDDVVQALKQWASREGADVDWGAFRS